MGQHTLESGKTVRKRGKVLCSFLMVQYTKGNLSPISLMEMDKRSSLMVAPISANSSLECFMAKENLSKPRINQSTRVVGNKIKCEVKEQSAQTMAQLRSKDSLMAET